jgi:chromosome segregation ATPase
MSIDCNDNYIQPSDVESEAEEYENDIENKQEEIDEKEAEIADLDEDEDGYEDDLATLGSELATLYDELEDIKEEAKDIIELRDMCNDYARGETLINEDIFTDYARQSAEDVDGINLDQWPYNCIDWDEAAEVLKQDYTTITWCGQEFYVRA